jgi:hypothetical protein
VQEVVVVVILNLGHNGLQIEQTAGVLLPEALLAAYFADLRALVKAFQQHCVIGKPLRAYAEHTTHSRHAAPTCCSDLSQMQRHDPR